MIRIMRKVLHVIQRPSKIVAYGGAKGFFKWIPDMKYIEICYKAILGKKMNWDNPKTFNEKLQWMKIYDKNPLKRELVDKALAKDYVSKKIGEEYVIPTIGVWDSIDEVCFDKLPSSFVIKTTHDSGGVYIYKNKNENNFSKVRRQLKKRLNNNFYYVSREWPYKDVKPRIIVEKYIEDKEFKELRDYKFYCFNGIVHAMLLACNRQNPDKEMSFDYYNKEFEHLELVNYWHPNSKEELKKPLRFDEMVMLAEKLSKGFPHVRIDFYEANERIYFGEFTFYDQGGFLRIAPEDWEIEWGNMIDLSLVKQ